MKVPPVIFPVVPMGKPRMTQRDRWAKRPPVLRYRAFKDELRIHVNRMPHLKATLAGGDVVRVSWVAYFPMPKSWTKRERAAKAGQPHRSKPDRDNVDKAILDALFEEDSGIASGHLDKRWDDGRGPRLEIVFETSASLPPAPERVAGFSEQPNLVASDLL